MIEGNCIVDIPFYEANFELDSVDNLLTSIKLIQDDNN
jgi:hypothetical protein